MSSPERTLLSRWTSLLARERVYQLPDGLEVESNIYSDVTRRRVFYDDVLLVTFHREASAAYLAVTGIIGLTFLAVGLGMLAADIDLWPLAVFFFAIAGPMLVLFFTRLIFGVDIITVFGRRSKAVLRFGMRKQQARTVYGQICATVRNTQRRIAEERGAAEDRGAAAASAAEVPADVPMPPAE